MTIKEIAKMAGVSISTVSKIVNNKDENINPQTRNRVLEIVKKYNYTPYGSVKTISESKKFLIGVLLRTSLSSNLFINGILQKAQNLGYGILLLESKDNPETEQENISFLCSRHVDGVIWEPISENSLSMETSFNRQNIPYFLVNSSFSERSFTIDFEKLGYILTEKLIQYRHTNLACLLKEESKRSEALFRGFQRCVIDNQIPFSEKMKLYGTDKNYLQRVIDNNVTGIISSHFALSLEFYEQMTKLHYFMPSDFSLVSLKVDIRESLSYPHISSIKIPYEEFGAYIVEKLIRKCEKNSDDRQENRFIPNVSFDNDDSVDRPPALRSRRFIVVGAINMDITFNVNHLPRHGDTTMIYSSTSTVGGKGCNQAIGVARLGNEVALIGELGTDTDSSTLFDVLEKENVLTQGIHRNKKQPTGKAYIYTESDGESAISILSGANGTLNPDDIDRRQYLFNNSGYCLISTEIPIATAVRAAEYAQLHGAKTIVKPSALDVLPSALLKKTNIFIPNRKEALLLSPDLESVEEQADYFLSLGPEIVIITLGHNGCYLRTSDISAYFPASEVIAVDTTGGADAFIAAFASYLSEGYPLEKAIRIAQYAAGISVSRQGTSDTLTNRTTLEALIAKKENDLI